MPPLPFRSSCSQKEKALIFILDIYSNGKGATIIKPLCVRAIYALVCVASPKAASAASLLRTP